MKRRPKVLISAAVLVVLVAATVLLLMKRSSGKVLFTTVEVDRGSIAEVVGATGTLQAVVTVQVGSQVSGIIQSLYADFNSEVTAGQVVARLDPSLFAARLGQAKANLTAAHANVDRAKAQVEDARQKYERARELLAENLLPASDHETAKANFDGAAAGVKAAEASVRQAAANVHQAEVDLDHTVIRAPIAGVVVNRSVDVGQTVAASFQAPTIFIIANDLAKMQVNASIDEADIGRVQVGQAVSFRVDAHPERTFDGIVEQIRLQPTTVQNVVTYNTIIAVENPRQLLKPGMTATVSVITRKADDVLRVPAAALRFRPEGFEMETDRGKATGSPRAEATPGAPSQGDGVAVASEGALVRRSDRTRGEGRPGNGRRRGEGRNGEGEGPRASRGKRALVFVLDSKGKPEPVRVTTGLSDGQYTEVREGVSEGSRVVTAEGAGPSASSNPSATQTGNPFQPQRRQRRQR